jgi:Protein of unknown function (DUF3592)
MLITFGVLFAVAGGIALLAGLSSMGRVRRLRHGGLTTWALPVPVPADSESAGSPQRMLLHYTLADGRVIERRAPAPARKSAPLWPGEKVLLWYDPADPDDVLVHGHFGQASNRALVAAGAALVFVGAGIAAIGH